MDNTWKENIYNSIKDFSDLEKQKRLWLGLDKIYASSFDEDISLLFDSFCFEEFIMEWEKDNLSKDILNELSLFKTMLDVYERQNSDEAILKDPAWISIVNKAKQIIKLWNYPLAERRLQLKATRRSR